MKLKKLIEKLDELYPENLKASYDNVGLMIGSRQKDVNKILLALDLTEEVLLEAKREKVDLIITHHPIFFYPLSQIDLEDNLGFIIKSLIEEDISVFSIHTNFDTVRMNSYLGELIGIKNQKVLSEKENVGIYGEIEKTTIKKYAELIKRIFGIEEILFYGKENQEIETVALLAGSGASYYKDAIEKKADLYITGDISYSKAIEIKRTYLSVMDIGHHVEHLFTGAIKKDFEDAGINIELVESKINTIPYIKL